MTPAKADRLENTTGWPLPSAVLTAKPITRVQTRTVSVAVPAGAPRLFDLSRRDLWPWGGQVAGPMLGEEDAMERPTRGRTGQVRRRPTSAHRLARTVAAALAAAGLVAVPALTASSDRLGYRSGTADAAGPLATFVSTSGLTHTDIADVATLRAGVGWDPGDPTSIDDDWVTAMNTVWDQLASEHPDAVLATGDMVGGFWGVDRDGTGIFGPVDTVQHKAQAVIAAGHAYEGTVRDQAAAHGLVMYPGMGDHEMGNFGTRGVLSADRFPAQAHWAWVRAWTDVFGRRPYYHVTLPGSVELWTLQPFHQSADGSVSAVVGRAQRRWLARSLEASTARWKIVQSEIPPYSSRGFTGFSTSGTHLLNADQVFRILAHHGVDLLLCAEFHEVDALQRHGIPEIIHGGALGMGHVNYLTIDVYRRTLRIALSRMAQAVVDKTETLWMPSQRNRPALHITMPPGATVTGHLTVSHDGIASAEGELVPH